MKTKKRKTDLMKAARMKAGFIETTRISYKTLLPVTDHHKPASYGFDHDFIGGQNKAVAV